MARIIELRPLEDLGKNWDKLEICIGRKYMTFHAHIDGTGNTFRCKKEYIQ